MAIEKLTEFAKTGQKDTDQLDLEVGFIVNRKPARQWFNWLFNTLTLKINEIIDADFMPKSNVVDNLTTDDATNPVSAKQAKLLQDNKLDANKRGAISGVASLDENKKVPVTELPSASVENAGILRLVNDLTTGGTDKAITAEAMKLFFNMFSGGETHIVIPCASRPDAPWVIQFNFVGHVTTGTDDIRSFNFAFPNSAKGILVSNTSIGNDSVNSIQARVLDRNSYRLKIKSVAVADNLNDYYWCAFGY